MEDDDKEDKDDDEENDDKEDKEDDDEDKDKHRDDDKYEDEDADDTKGDVYKEFTEFTFKKSVTLGLDEVLYTSTVKGLKHSISELNNEPDDSELIAVDDIRLSCIFKCDITFALVCEDKSVDDAQDDTHVENDDRWESGGNTDEYGAKADEEKESLTF